MKLYGFFSCQLCAFIVSIHMSQTTYGKENLHTYSIYTHIHIYAYIHSSHAPFSILCLNLYLFNYQVKCLECTLHTPNGFIKVIVWKQLSTWNLNSVPHFAIAHLLNIATTVSEKCAGFLISFVLSLTKPSWSWHQKKELGQCKSMSTTYVHWYLAPYHVWSLIPF